MAKERPVKCPECGKTNSNREDTVLHKKRYYCKGECIDSKLEDEENKSESNADWVILYEYIVEMFGHKPDGRMFKQLGEYRKPPYEYTNLGMYLTLKYFFDTKEHKTIQGTGLGIIPYVYEEAKQNYIKQMEISEYNTEFASSEHVKRIKVTDNNKKNKLRVQLISFDDIDDELDDGGEE